MIPTVFFFFVLLLVALPITTTANNNNDNAAMIPLPGATGSGPYEAVKDWMAAFTSKYPEAGLSASSVGSGAAQSALWGDVNCRKKPVASICDTINDNDTMATTARPTTTTTVWGIGGGTLNLDVYALHEDRGLAQLPALGGPILVTYSKDVTGDLGASTSRTLQLRLSTIAAIFNNSIVYWNDTAIQDDNPLFVLPKERITVLVRSDESGMSQTLTQAIQFANPNSWPEESVGKKPSWPLANLIQSSSSMTTTCQDTNNTPQDVKLLNFKADGQTGIGIGLLRRPYSIGYLELGYFSTLQRFVAQAHIRGPGRDNDYEAATVNTLQRTMDGLVDELEPETLSLTLVDNDTPEGGYPISRYIYWYLKTEASEYESCYQAWLLYTFVEWTLTDELAEEIALGHGWVTIPTKVKELALAKLQQVQCHDDDDVGSAMTIYAKDYIPAPYRPEVRNILENNNRSTTILAIVVPVVLLIGIGAYVYVERKKRLIDSVWAVKPLELRFDDPPVICGRGTFGLVVLAEYRGTQVAVKRVIPPKLKFAMSNSSGGTHTNSSTCSGLFRRSILGKGDLASMERIPLSDSKRRYTAEKNDVRRDSGSVSLVEEGVGGNTIVGRGSGSGSGVSFANHHPEEMNGVAHRRGSFFSSLGSADSTTDNNNKTTLSAKLDSSNDLEMPLNDVQRNSGSLVEEGVGGNTNEDNENYQTSMNSSEQEDLTRSGGYYRNSGDNFTSSSSGNNNNNTKEKKNGTFITGRSTLKSYFKFGFRTDETYEKLKQDFILEMRHLATLRHPNITTVMGAVIDKREEPMLVMEYMEYGSLHDVIHNETVPLDGDLLLPILQDICQGLRFLHVANPQVIHGDLKAQNILVDSRYRAKVADFGLSQKQEIGATGTPLWMAPELLRGDSENTSASDVYSFGIILYEMYSRKEPYQDEHLAHVIRDICDHNKRPPVPLGCPTAVATIQTECLDANPHARPSFEELDLRLKRLNADMVEPGGVKKMKRDLQNSQTLLYDIFPSHIADALQEGRKVDSERHECVTIFFSDIVGFTIISSHIGAYKVANMLDRLYSDLDDLSVHHDIFKIETIGDAYVAVSNCVRDQSTDHVKRIAEFSIDAMQAASNVIIDVDQPELGYVQIRVGFHTGPVISDVVGNRLPRYTLFGDTINTASRMESNSQPGRIHCSDVSSNLLQQQAPNILLESRGHIPIKGKGMMHTYWVDTLVKKKAAPPLIVVKEEGEIIDRGCNVSERVV